MENSATEKQSKSKTSRLSAFIRNTWLAVKSRGKKDAPLQAPSGTDPADPQPGPSHLRSAARQDQTDPKPGPSHLRSAVRQGQTDPKPGPSHLRSAVRQGQTDPQPGPSHLRSAARQDQTDPQPGPSQLGSAEEKQTKMKNSCTFFERMCRTVKSAAVLMKLKKAAPLHPQPDTDSADPQPGPSAPEPPASLDMTDLQLDPSFFEPPALLDLTDLLPAPLAIPESPGADSERSEYPRTASFPGPSTLPFSELYEVEEDIGQGYFGTVLKGIRKSDGQQVAIKFITKRETGRFADRYINVPGVSKPLFAEVALNLLLNRPPLSPYIVHMLDWFEEEDRFILILEYSQPCRDLFRFVLRETLSESQARDLMYQAVLGAKHCLDGGVFHRDIKLDNFVINTEMNQVKLIDFGCGEIAKSVCKGQFIGFACPPEYFADFQYEAEPTTVWSLGIMMYRTVCRCQPLRNEHGRLRFDSRVSADFQDLITRCLALDPAKRATMEEILQHDWFQQEQMSGVSLESGSMT